MAGNICVLSLSKGEVSNEWYVGYDAVKDLLLTYTNRDETVVGPGSYCSPRYRMPFSSRNKGADRAWQILILLATS